MRAFDDFAVSPFRNAERDVLTLERDSMWTSPVDVDAGGCEAARAPRGSRGSLGPVSVAAVDGQHRTTRPVGRLLALAALAARSAGK